MTQLSTKATGESPATRAFGQHAPEVAVSNAPNMAWLSRFSNNRKCYLMTETSRPFSRPTPSQFVAARAQNAPIGSHASTRLGTHGVRSAGSDALHGGWRNAYSRSTKAGAWPDVGAVETGRFLGVTSDDSEPAATFCGLAQAFPHVAVKRDDFRRPRVGRP